MDGIVKDMIHTIPEGCLFVTGSFCKDFRMLKSSNPKVDYELSHIKTRDESYEVITGPFLVAIY